MENLICRALRKDNKGWVYGLLFRIQETDNFYQTVIVDKNKIIFPVFEDTVCYKTDIQDCKEKDVYQNDIINRSIKGNDKNFEICLGEKYKWSKEQGRYIKMPSFYAKLVDTQGDYRNEIHIPLDMFDNNIHIVGNTIQNKGLIENKKSHSI